MLVRVRNMVAAQIAKKVLPKNLRISAILVAIYQVLISHVLLFVMVLGLIHAAEMASILSDDIQDQQEREDYFFIPTMSSGESLNSIRFKEASYLAFATWVIMEIGTALSIIYLLSCLGLLVGTLRSRSSLMLPWLIIDSIGAILVFVIMIASANSEYNVLYYCGGEIQYWSFCGIITSFNVLILCIVDAYYLNVKKVAETRKLAASKSAIPMPAPEQKEATQVPYHYRNENMYLGEGGIKHFVSDTPAEESFLI